MAESNITFGIPQTNSTPTMETNFGTANSTPSSVPLKSVGGGSGGGGGGSWGVQGGLDYNAQPSTTAPTTSDEVSNVIDTDQLESNQSSGVSLPPATSTQVFEPSVPTPTTTTSPTPTVDPELEKLRKENEKMRDDVYDALQDMGNISKFEDRVARDVDLQKKRELKTEIDNKIMKKQRDFDLALRKAEDTFGTRAQKRAIANEITKDYNRQLADLSIIQMARAGEFNDAQAYVNRKVELELQDRQANLNSLMFLYTENKERFTTVEQRDFEKRILEEQRAYDLEYDKIQRFENMKLALIEQAISNGSGNAVLSQIQSADSMDKLLSIRGIGPQGSSLISPPTIKNINGRDMQWNGTTGQWEEIDTDAQASQVQQSLDKFTWLREQVAEAKRIAEDTSGLKTPVGPSRISRIAGDIFVGNTTNKQLKAIQDTIQTSMLTLSGDPNIRDFFGPQMSEADVRMMVSGATTLNADGMNSPNYVKELERIDDFLNRGQTGARNKLNGIQAQPYNVITAPDGTQVEIID